MQDLVECLGCPLGGPRVGAKGPQDAELVIIGESPGVQEVRQGIPFVGPSGEVLEKTLGNVVHNAYILNALQCYPTKRVKKDPNMMVDATHMCSSRLGNLIKEYPRKLIVTLGNNALWSITGDYSTKITQVRGFLRESELSTLGVLPALHPAALLRGTGSYRQFHEDMTYARELLELGATAIKEPPEVKYTNVTTEEEAKWIVKKLAKSKSITCDLETTGLNALEDTIIVMGIRGDDRHIYNITPQHIYLFKSLIENPNIIWNFHNGKFDVRFLRAIGIEAVVGDDTMLMSYTLDENPGVHDLESVGNDILGAPNYKNMLAPYLPTKNTSYAEVPIDVLNEYLAFDVCNTGELRSILKRRVEADKDLSKLYHKVLLPASELLSRVEHNGFYTNIKYVEENDKNFGEEITTVEQEMQKAAGTLFNPNSPQQVAQVLYHHLGLPNRYKNSTAVDVLQKLPQHEVVKLLMRHRIIKKAHSTYIKPIYKRRSSEGRIHSTFMLHGTKTGRLATRNPNIQNIPRDPQLRGMYTAAPGCVLIEVDLSQAELRSLACLSNDPLLVEIYINDKDLHLEVEKYLFGTEHHKENRVKCKNVNFGIIYGITGVGLSEQTGKLVRECQEWIDGWYKRFPVAAEFINKCRDTVRRGQVITTIFGRKKRAGLVTADNIRALQNEAANFPHQSIASDITLCTAIKVEPQLRMWDVKIVNLVHDSIIMEVPAKDDKFVIDVGDYVVEAMEATPYEWGLKRVPFRADIEVGERWGHLHKLEEGFVV